MGSFGKDLGSVAASYGISKAALNMLVSLWISCAVNSELIRGHIFRHTSKHASDPISSYSRSTLAGWKQVSLAYLNIGVDSNDPLLDMGSFDVPDVILEVASKITDGECYFYDSTCEMFDKRDTEQGGVIGPIDAPVAVAQVIKTVSSATAADVGKFLNFSGGEVPW
jgi:hypothetical protein